MREGGSCSLTPAAYGHLSWSAAAPCLSHRTPARAPHIHLYIVVLYVISGGAACTAEPRRADASLYLSTLYVVYVYGCIRVFSPGTQKYTEKQTRAQSFLQVYWSCRPPGSHADQAPCWNIGSFSAQIDKVHNGHGSQPYLFTQLMRSTTSLSLPPARNEWRPTDRVRQARRERTGTPPRRLGTEWGPSEVSHTRHGAYTSARV